MFNHPINNMTLYDRIHNYLFNQNEIIPNSGFPEFGNLNKFYLSELINKNGKIRDSEVIIDPQYINMNTPQKKKKEENKSPQKKNIIKINKEEPLFPDTCSQYTENNTKNYKKGNKEKIYREIEIMPTTLPNIKKTNNNIIIKKPVESYMKTNKNTIDDLDDIELDDIEQDSSKSEVDINSKDDNVDNEEIEGEMSGESQFIVEDDPSHPKYKEEDIEKDCYKGDDLIDVDADIKQQQQQPEQKVIETVKPIKQKKLPKDNSLTNFDELCVVMKDLLDVKKNYIPAVTSKMKTNPFRNAGSASIIEHHTNNLAEYIALKIYSFGKNDIRKIYNAYILAHKEIQLLESTIIINDKNEYYRYVNQESLNNQYKIINKKLKELEMKNSNDRQKIKNHHNIYTRIKDIMNKFKPTDTNYHKYIKDFIEFVYSKPDLLLSGFVANEKELDFSPPILHKKFTENDLKNFKNSLPVCIVSGEELKLGDNVTLHRTVTRNPERSKDWQHTKSPEKAFESTLVTDDVRFFYCKENITLKDNKLSFFNIKKYINDNNDSFNEIKEDKMEDKQLKNVNEIKNDLNDNVKNKKLRKKQDPNTQVISDEESIDEKPKPKTKTTPIKNQQQKQQEDKPEKKEAKTSKKQEDKPAKKEESKPSKKQEDKPSKKQQNDEKQVKKPPTPKKTSKKEELSSQSQHDEDNNKKPNKKQPKETTKKRKAEAIENPNKKSQKNETKTNPNAFSFSDLMKEQNDTIEPEDNNNNNNHENIFLKYMDTTKLDDNPLYYNMKYNNFCGLITPFWFMIDNYYRNFPSKSLNTYKFHEVKDNHAAIFGQYMDKCKRNRDMKFFMIGFFEFFTLLIYQNNKKDSVIINNNNKQYKHIPDEFVKDIQKKRKSLEVCDALWTHYQSNIEQLNPTTKQYFNDYMGKKIEDIPFFKENECFLLDFFAYLFK